MSEEQKDYNRERNIQEKFNSFVTEWNKNGGTLRNNMKLDHVVLLKHALRNVHNMATLETTKLLVKCLAKLFPVEFGREKQKEVLECVLETKPNANGYDVEYKDKAKKFSFVAEIKCNIPINEGNTFGEAQKSGIKKDLEHLRKGKPKSQLGLRNKKSLDGYYKFLGVYDDKDGKVSQAMHSLCKNMKGICFQVPKKCEDLDRSTIYIVFLK